MPVAGHAHSYVDVLFELHNIVTRVVTLNYLNKAIYKYGRDRALAYSVHCVTFRDVIHRAIILAIIKLTKLLLIGHD